MSASDVTAFIEGHTGTLAPLTRTMSVAYWMSRTTGRKEYLEETARLEAEWQRLYSSSEIRDQVGRWLSDGGGVAPVERRVLQVLHNLYTGNQKTPDEIAEIVALESRMSELFTNYRGHIGERAVSNNSIDAILRQSDNPAERREAWEASKEIGVPSAELIVQLVERRNGYARRMGYRDHFALSLALQEIDESFLWETFALLEAKTTAPFAAAKEGLDNELAARFRCRPSELRPWHYADPFFQRAPRIAAVNLDSRLEGRDLVELATRTYDRLGLDIRDLVDRSDLWARDGKDQSGFCMDVDREGDIRVLVNLVANERWANTLLHEYGHAVYDKYLDRELPFVIREPAHIITTEAMALLMGRLVQDPVWLGDVLGVPKAEIAPLEPHLASYQRLSMLIFVRWGLTVTHFERELYRDPKQDLAGRWWEFVRRFQMVTGPDGRRSPDWAAKIHVAQAPVYYQNYVLGEIVASQLKAWMRRETGGHFLRSSRSGELLVERFFRPGGSMTWRELVNHATGEPLDPRHFFQEFVASG